MGGRGSPHDDGKGWMNFGGGLTGEHLTVQLCGVCGSLTDKFLELYRVLEKIQMEMDHRIGMIHGRMTEGEMRGGNMDRFSKCAKGFKRELLKKCSAHLNSLKPRVKVQRLSRTESKQATRSPTEEGGHSNSPQVNRNLESTSPSQASLNSADLFVEPVKTSLMEKAERDQSSKIGCKFKCNFCARLFGQKHALKRHVEVIHFRIRKFRCWKCDQKFSQNIHLTKHLRARACHSQEPAKTNHSKSNKEPKPSGGPKDCSYCGKSFTNQWHVQRHIDSVHLQLRRYGCELCGLKFKRLTHLTRHKKICVPEGSDLMELAAEEACDTFANLEPTPDDDFITPDLDLDETDGNFKASWRRPKRGGKISSKQCRLCGKIFKCFSSLRRHVEAHEKKTIGSSPKQSLTCDICQRSFTQRTHLQRHIDAVHLQLKEYGCDKCGQKFSQRHHLQRHQRKSCQPGPAARERKEQNKMKLEVQDEAEEFGEVKPIVIDLNHYHHCHEGQVLKD